MADNLSKGQLLSYIKRLKQQAANEKDTANSLRSEIEALRADKAAKLVKIQELTGKFASLELPLEELSSENDRLKAKLKEIEQRHAEELVKIRSEAAQAKAELVLQLRTEHTSAIETVKELLAQETETKILQLKADHKKELESMQNQVHQQTNEVTESLCSEQILQAENAAKQSKIDQLTAKIASMEQFHNDTLRSKIQHIEERHAQDLAGELDSMHKKHQAALTEATHRIEFEKKQQHDTLLTAALLEQKESFTELKVKLEARIQEQDKEYKKKLNDMEFMHAEKIAQKEQELAAALTASANCESNADLNLHAALTAQEDELLKRLAERETELMKAHTEAIAEKERQSLLDREALVSKYETELNSKNSLKAALQKKDEEHAKVLAEREAELNQVIAEKDETLVAFKCESQGTLESALQKKDEEHAKILAEREAEINQIIAEKDNALATFELQGTLESALQKKDEEYAKVLAEREAELNQVIAEKDELLAAFKCESLSTLKSALQKKDEEHAKLLAECEAELNQVIAEKDNALATLEFESRGSLESALRKKDEEHAKILAEREAEINQIIAEKDNALATFELQGTLESALQKKDEEYAKVLAEREAELNQVIAEKDESLAGFKCESLSTLESALQKKDEEYAKVLAEREAELNQVIAEKDESLAAFKCESLSTLKSALQKKDEEHAKLLAECETELNQVIAEKDNALATLEFESRGTLESALQKKDEEHAKVLAEREAELNQVIAEKDESLAAFKCESLSTLKSALQKKDEEYAKLLAECETELNQVIAEKDNALATLEFESRGSLESALRKKDEEHAKILAEREAELNQVIAEKDNVLATFELQGSLESALQKKDEEYAKVLAEREAELNQVIAEKDNALAAFKCESLSTLKSALQKKDEEHAKLLAECEAQHKAELEAARVEAMEDSSEFLRAEYDGVINALKARHESALEAMRTEIRKQIDTTESEQETHESHAREMAELSEKYEIELRELTQEHHRVLEAERELRISDIKKVRASAIKKQNELKAELDAAETEITRLETRIRDLTQENTRKLQAVHEEKIADIKKCRAAAVKKQNEMKAELDAADAVISKLETQVHALRLESTTQSQTEWTASKRLADVERSLNDRLSEAMTSLTQAESERDDAIRKLEVEKEHRATADKPQQYLASTKNEKQQLEDAQRQLENLEQRCEIAEQRAENAASRGKELQRKLKLLQEFAKKRDAQAKDYERNGFEALNASLAAFGALDARFEAILIQNQARADIEGPAQVVVHPEHCKKCKEAHLLVTEAQERAALAEAHQAKLEDDFKHYRARAHRVFSQEKKARNRDPQAEAFESAANQAMIIAADAVIAAARSTAVAADVRIQLFTRLAQQFLNNNPRLTDIPVALDPPVQDIADGGWGNNELEFSPLQQVEQFSELKATFFKFLNSDSQAERLTLLPIISNILQLEPAEFVNVQTKLSFDPNQGDEKDDSQHETDSPSSATDNHRVGMAGRVGRGLASVLDAEISIPFF